MSKRTVRSFLTDRGKLKGRDSVDTILRLPAIAAALVGGFMGWLAGHFLSRQAGRPNDLMVIVPMAIVGAVLGYTLVLLILNRASSLASLLFTSGSSTPSLPDFSNAKTKAVRGDHRGAIDLYRGYVAASPEMAMPYIEIARLERDHLGRYEEAVRWFRRCRAHAELDPNQEILVARELFEVLDLRMGSPERALPDLRSLVERYGESPAVEWAEKVINRLSASVSESPS